MKTTSRILANVASSWFVALLQGVTGFLLTPYILGLLGKEQYGLFALVGVIVLIALLLDLGVRGAVARHFTEQLALGRIDRANSLLSTAFLFFATTGTAASLPCFFGVHWIVDFFGVSASLRPTAELLVKYYAPAYLILPSVSPVFGAVLVAHNRYDIENMIQVCTAILRPVGIIVLVGAASMGLWGIAAVELFNRLFGMVMRLILAKRIMPAFSFWPTQARWRELRHLMTLGSSMLGNQIADTISVQSDPLVLTRYLGPASVAIYKPAVSITSLARPVVLSLTSQLMPVSTKLHATGNVRDLQQLLIRGTRYTMLLAAPVCVFLAVFSNELAYLWLHKVLGDDCQTVAQLILGLAIIDYVRYAAGTQWPVLLGRNRVRFMVWGTQVPAAVVNIALSVFFVGYLDWGPVGVIVATLVLILLQRPLLIVYTARVCQMSAWRYVRDGYLRAVGLSAALLAACVLMRWLVRPASWPVVFGCVIGTTVLWAVLLRCIGLTRPDRELAAEYCGKAAAKVKLAVLGRPRADQ